MIKMQEPPKIRKPSWLKVKLNTNKNYTDMKQLMHKHNLHTVCEEARCPNIYECWDNRTATVMILGDVCTRSCRFCSVKTGRPLKLDLDEPKRVADFVSKLKLRHVVVTSVDRDDLVKDFGANIWYETISAIHRAAPECTVEVLTPDFKGYRPSLDRVFESEPEIFSHNIECVESVSKKIRFQSRWGRSLNVLEYAVNRGMLTKTGMMVGLGETDEEVYETMDIVNSTGVKIFNIGQYLQPTLDNIKVDRYVEPSTFKKYKDYGISIGFDVVESGPLVRSSYHADQQARKYNKKNINDNLA